MKPKQRNLTITDKILLWFNYLLVAALLLSYLAANIDPQKFWPVSFFGLAYPPLLFANSLMVVYWLFRNGRYALLSLLGIAIGYHTLFNNVGFHSSGSDGKQNSNALRVMTYNVHSFKRYGAANDISTKHEILDLIRRQNPDILGIQEFYSRKSGEYDMLDSIKSIMKTRHCYYEMFGSGDAGIAIFSKYPITGHGMLQLTFKGSGNQCLYIDVAYNRQKLRMYSIHLQSINFEPEDYDYLDKLSRKGKTDMQATRRLGSKLKRAFIKRSEQVFLIKDYAAKCPYPYIIAGDFNDTPSSFAVNQMASGLKNAFREKGWGLGRTYNGSFPNYQIDYVMVSKQIAVTDYHIISKKLSDHYPLQTDLVVSYPKSN